MGLHSLKVIIMNNSELKVNMTKKQRDQLGSLPTTHRNCLEKCGVSRPGKTKRDRAKGKK